MGETDPAAGRLRPYLRSLWDREVAFETLPRGPMRPVLAGEPQTRVPGLAELALSPSIPARAPSGPRSTLGLPARADQDPAAARRLEYAIAAHAGAHLAHARAPLERGSLKPVQLALVGVLEDARVEWLAARDFPGLHPLWLGFHRAAARDATDLESLLARLARALIDPGHDDPHPWVIKGRRFFEEGLAAGRAPFEDPAALRRAASMLGNDLGQMRVQFNARAYAVAPDYRDDNSHLWIDGAAESAPEVPDVLIPVEAGRQTQLPEPQDDAGVTQWRYPEWDRLIGCHRQDWVRVHERPLPATHAADTLRARLRECGPAVRGLARAIGGLCRTVRPGTARTDDGERFDLAALVAVRIDQRLGAPPDPRVFLGSRREHRSIAVAVLVDASVSTARPDAQGVPLLTNAVVTALVLARALEAAGGACTVDAFRSNGRDEVVVHPLKPFATPADADAVLRSAAGLEPQWSTRVGAAVRHASRRLAARDEDHRIVLLLTDGEPHDIDLHDPAYLVEDLRHAVAAARDAGVRVVCADLAATAPDGAATMRDAFRGRGWRRFRHPESLARELVMLLRSGIS